MKRKIFLGLVLPSLTLLAATLHAAEVAPPPPAADASQSASPAAPVDTTATASPEAEGGTTVTTVITPRLFVFDYFDGVGEDKTNYLERYDYLEGFSGDTRSGVFADLDLDVIANNGARDLFVLERRGFGEHNHRGSAKYSNDALSVYGSYSHYRSATGGIDYLLSPDQVDGGEVSSGPYQTFNDDANRYDYSIDRTTYGAGFKVKPSVLGDMATVSVDYEGYQRDGNKFAPFFLDTPGLAGNDRWRGINLNVDERMNKVGLTLSASPKKMFEVAYEVAYEQFVNDVGELQMERDVLGPAGVDLSGVGANPRISSFFYVPDTKLTSHAIRASKNFSDRVVVAAGYGMSTLKQDSFTEREIDDGHTKGQIGTDNAYLTASAIVTPDVSVEGHIKYYNRDNESTFPDGLIAPTNGPGRLVSPRINSIKSLDYGVSTNWRPDFIGSNLTAGWRRLDRDRDLTFGVDPNHDIQPAQSLYREKTLSDELYLKWTARPAKGWTTRLTPSYTWADKTGLVAEPEEAFMLKAMASYAAPAGWLVSGFYDYKHKQNGNHTFTDGSAGPGTPLTYNQDIDSTLHSAGLSLNVMPRDNVNVYANLYWVQDDFSSYLFTTDVQRWNPAVTFTLVDQPNYKINSYVFSLGGDWQYNDKLKLNGSYTFSKSTGDVASGTVFTELQNATGMIDSIIDNTLHSLSLGADYLINDKTTLRVNYIYDYYDDNAYDLLTGGVHMLAIGVAFAL